MKRKLKLPAAEEIKALRGIEFKYELSDENGPDVDGILIDVYVAQADRKKGITIMGTLPDGIGPEFFGIKDGVDTIIQCCASYGDYENQNYIDVVCYYVKCIKQGLFISEDNSEGGGIEYMKDVCSF